MGKSVKSVGSTICVWPDCGLKYEEKKPFEKHMYSHTDPKARYCPYPKKSPNGRPNACRFRTLCRSAIGRHEKQSHATDRLLPDGSLAPQVVDLHTLVGLAMAGSPGGGRGTQGEETELLPEMNLDGLLQIEPEEDDADFVNPPLLKPAITTIEEPKEAGEGTANHAVCVVPCSPTLVPSVSKRRARRRVKNTKEGVTKNDSRSATQQTTKKKKQVSQYLRLQAMLPFLIKPSHYALCFLDSRLWSIVF